MSEFNTYARKYRPLSLNQYKGNTGIITTIKKFIGLGDKKPQVLLLKGSAGCGKTSLARLLCSAYSCTNPKADGSPCEECDTCREFAHYISTGDCSGLIDITEIDSTGENGKKDVEELLDSINMPSLTGNWKCYIFDECHLLSQAAQARLLKTIEEPPAKVLICLCTTNPEKLLDTIHSRCQYVFNVQRPMRKELVTLMQDICIAEGVTANLKTLNIIAIKSNNTPRNALHLLQSLVNEQGKALDYDTTAKTLGIIADKYYFLFYKLLLSAKLQTYQYISFIAEVSGIMPLSQFLDGLMEFTLRGIYIYNNISVEGLDKTELKAYADLFVKFKPADIVFLIDYLTNLRSDPDLEIKLIKLGYTGIKTTVSEESNTGAINLNDLTTSASSDTETGIKNFQESMEITEEERSDILKQQMAPVSLDDALGMFNGIVVHTDK